MQKKLLTNGNVFKRTDGAEHVGVFDNCKGNAQESAELYSYQCFDTYEEMLLCPQVDIVNICTPSGTHAPLAIEAAVHRWAVTRFAEYAKNILYKVFSVRERRGACYLFIAFAEIV